jgi:hypothetical protein
MAHYPLDHHLRRTYRWIAALGGLYLLLTGVIGLARTWGDPFLHHGGDWSLGLRVNPASAWLLTVLGALVLLSSLAGAGLQYQASTVLGWAIMVLAMVQMAVLQTDANALNASMVNVIVLAAIGLVVLTAGLYGRVTPRTA